MNRIRLAYLSICLLVSIFSNAQSSQERDSIWKIFKDVNTPDSAKLKALDDISWSYLFSDSDSSIVMANQLHELAVKLGNRHSQSIALNTLGAANEIKGEYPKAIEYYHKGLKIQEEIGDSIGVALTYGNIGIIYDNNNDYEEALEYYSKGLKILEKVEHPSAKSAFYNNIGLVHSNMAQYDQALGYYLKALDVRKKYKDQEGIADIYVNLGMTYKTKKEYKKSIRYYLKAIEIDKARGDKRGMANSFCLIGGLYNLQEQFQKALSVCQKGLKMAREVKFLEEEKLSCQCLQEAYEGLGNDTKSLAYFKQYVAIKDSLTNEKNTKEITEREMQYQFDKQHFVDSLHHSKQQQLKDFEIKEQQAIIEKEKTMKYSLYGGLLLVLIFSIVIYNRLQLTRRQNKIIESQKQEVELARMQLEEQNEDILDSITYAKRIQQAMLQSEDYQSKHLPPHFILFKPKDIVSGDFYWAHERDNYLYMAAADCTGHGVPGAFMSMLGISFLNEIVNGNIVLTPSEILDELRNRIIRELSQSDKAGGAMDGMDISLMRFEYTTKAVNWAGANNPLWIIRTEKLASENVLDALEEITPNKQPISHYTKMTPFTNHVVNVNTGDRLYLFTDGFADQFGGPKGKKFKYKPFKKTILETVNQPMKTQKASLDEVFETWRGNLEQIDDVCIIGVKI